MSDSELLSQDEIDALLGGDDQAPEAAPVTTNESKIKPYDPATHYRVIRERLDSLDIINERFARAFRQSLFNLLRRTADVTVSSVKIVSFNEFSRNLPSPSNLNLVSMKPLKGNGLVVFPPSMVYMVVEQLYGGDGKSALKAEGREFTLAEQKVILRMVNHAIECYKAAWGSVYQLDIEYVRSEMQPRFVNLTNSQNEMVVNTTFNFEVGSFPGQFNIALPYLMIEPIKNLLNGPLADTYQEDEEEWGRKMQREIQDAGITLSVELPSIETTFEELMRLRVGDMFDIDTPPVVEAKVQGIPVFSCYYGSHNGYVGVKVKDLKTHYHETINNLSAK